MQQFYTTPAGVITLNESLAVSKLLLYKMRN